MKNKFFSFILAICLIIPTVFMLSACGEGDKKDENLGTGISTAQLEIVGLNGSTITLPNQSGSFKIKEIIDNIDDTLIITWEKSSDSIYTALKNSLFSFSNKNEFGEEEVIANLSEDYANSKYFFCCYEFNSKIYAITLSYSLTTTVSMDAEEMNLTISYYDDDYDVRGSSFITAIEIDVSTKQTNTDNNSYFIDISQIPVVAGTTYYYEITGFEFYDIAISTSGYAGSGKIEVYDNSSPRIKLETEGCNTFNNWANLGDFTTISESSCYYIVFTSNCTMNITLTVETAPNAF